jgi:hypothetical protein
MPSGWESKQDQMTMLKQRVFWIVVIVLAAVLTWNFYVNFR